MEAKAMINKKVAYYYARGLNYKEIGKLLDVSSRTVQRCVKESNLSNQQEHKTIQQEAFELSAKGFSYTQIAKRLKVSRTSIYLWHKRKPKEANTTP